MIETNSHSINSDDISGIRVSLHIDDDQKLFVLLARDGTINRLGTGSEDNEEIDLFMGKSDLIAFESVLSLADPVISSWIGGYAAPDPKGKPCKLVVGFQTAEGEALTSRWEYGSESQGPPPDVCSLVIKAVEVTDDWYEQQKEIAAGKG